MSLSAIKLMSSLKFASLILEGFMKAFKVKIVPVASVTNVVLVLHLQLISFFAHFGRLSKH